MKPGDGARAVSAAREQHKHRQARTSALKRQHVLDSGMTGEELLQQQRTLKADFQRREAVRQITADLDVLSRAALTPMPQTVECPACDNGTVKTGEGWKAQHRRCVTCQGTGRVLATSNTKERP